jgi:hypothetical protein
VGKATPGLQVSRAASDLSQLLRARAFAVEGDSTAVARVRANLQAGPAALQADAAVWIGAGPPRPDSLAIGLGEHGGLLGPHSFGFLNNIDGIAPLSVPIAEQPRRGSVALVVPRRDALPEVLPLLCRHDLGVSWLISVGDADPAEVVRFLAVDPATTGVLLALGRGVRAPTLQSVLSAKPVVVLEPPGAPWGSRDPALHRAVCRRAGAQVVHDLEEWLAHGALLEAGAATPGPAAPPTKKRGAGEPRARAALIVVGGGADLVSSEAARAGLPAPTKLDLDDPRAADAVLRKAADRAEVIVLCGASYDIAELRPPQRTLRVDLTQPERLRALLRAVARPAQPPADQPEAPVRVDADRVQAVLADLPPPLYVAEDTVSDEPLSDHDCKRLLHAYGVRVSRQAPVSTATAALRTLLKLGLPVALVPPLPPLPPSAPDDGVAATAAAEQRLTVVCTTQAEVKRHATLLLAQHPYILMREVIPPGPRLRAVVRSERGLGQVLRVAAVPPADAATQWQAALVPLHRGEARALADELAADAQQDTPLGELLTQLAAAAADHELRLDVLIAPAAEAPPGPLVVHATGELKRVAAKR